MSQVVILHGWSDKSSSFKPLAEFLQANGYDAIPIWLGDYKSLDDDVRIEDVGKRMESVLRQLIDEGPLEPPFDLIVHSTGGLVAREWLSAHYAHDMGACPVKRLIMLAPANFGSRLASTGKSLVGRVIKGWDNWFASGAETAPYRPPLLASDKQQALERAGARKAADRAYRESMTPPLGTDTTSGGPVMNPLPEL